MAGKKSILVFAAGGVIQRKEDDHVIIIYRKKYKDWSLPKGKLNKNESWEEAAIREVKEETGFTAKITGVIDTITYPVKRKYKVVIFFLMKVTGRQGKQSWFDKGDVKVEWVPVKEAIRKLSYQNQKEVLKKKLNNLTQNK